MKHMDAHMPKAHEGTESDASNNQRMGARLVQEIYRGHTPTMLVRQVIQDGNFTDYPIFNMDESEHFAMSEMG